MRHSDVICVIAIISDQQNAQLDMTAWQPFNVLPSVRKWHEVASVVVVFLVVPVVAGSSSGSALCQL